MCNGNEADIRRLLRWMDTSLPEPNSFIGEREFDRRSAAKWAANEILEELINNPFACGLTIAQEFTLEMSALRFLGKKEDTTFITAYETARDIWYLMSYDD